jgi:hypothetical protein
MILEVMKKMRQKVGMKRRKIIKREVRQKRKMGRITEKTRKITRPKYLEDYTVLAPHAESFIEVVPECFEDISSRPDQNQWIKAVNEEMQALKENDTWICPLEEKYWKRNGFFE